MLSPAATEIEAETVRWIAEFIGYPDDCRRPARQRRQHGELRRLLRGARREGAVEDPRARARRARAASACARTPRPRPTLDPEGRRPVGHRHRRGALDPDRAGPAHGPRGAAQGDRGRPQGRRPAVPGRRHRGLGRARARSTTCPASRALCKEETCGSTSTARTAALRPRCPTRRADLRALSGADSVAVDPHKWLYAPLEAGCALVRDPAHLRQRVLVSPAVLPFRRGAQLRRLRHAELARVPRAQGVAAAQAGRRRRLPPDDGDDVRARARARRRGAPGSRARAVHLRRSASRRSASCRRTCAPAVGRRCRGRRTT